MSGFSKQAEERLINCVRKVAAYVDEEGMDPTAAVVKTASEEQVPPPFVPLLAQAYNHGRAAVQREKCSSLACNLETYPLASADKAMKELYPDQVEAPNVLSTKSAVSAEYSRPPRSKAASMLTPIAVESKTVIREKTAQRDINEATRRYVADVQRVKRAAENLRREAGVIRDRLAGTLDKVAEYFQAPAAARDFFATVEYNVSRLYGPAGQAVMDSAYQLGNLKEKRASGPVHSLRPVREEAEPYVSVRQAIELGREALEKYAELLDAEAKIDERPMETLRKKEATVASTFLGASLADGLTKNLPGVMNDKSPDAVVESYKSKLNAPSHLEELRQIRAQAMLADLLRNDEVISGHEHGEVVDAFNELAALSPRAASQAAIMRPLLRKRLTSGAFEPYEIAQLPEMEKNIRETEGASNDGRKNPILAAPRKSPALG